MKSQEERLTWAMFWQMIGPSLRTAWDQYLLIVFCVLVAAVAQVGEPILFGKMLDEMFAGSDRLVLRIAPLLGAWALIYVTSIVIGQIGQWLSWRVGHRVNSHFFHAMMTRVIAWDPDRFGRESSGAIAKRVDQAWDRSFDVASRLFVDVLPQGVGFVVVLGAGLFLDWRMTLASLVMVPVIIIVTLGIYQRTRERQDALGKSWEKLSTDLYEMLQNILPIKIFGGEKRVLKALEDRATDVGNRQLDIDKVWGGLSAGNGIIRLLARGIVIAVGVMFIAEGSLTIGVLVAFLGMLDKMLSPFDYLLGDVLQRMRRVQSAFGRLSRDWFASNLITEDAHPLRVRDVLGDIVFDCVSYRYAGKKKDAIRDVSFSIPAGTSLALVGRSGSGKSTLVKFINRFLDPKKGVVSIDGVDLRHAKITDIRAAVGVVQQETVLFDDTVIENMKFARPSATRAEIEQACRAAQAHEFITKLPRGYDTIVGERGVKLSGGERQRLSLARVFLADPPILILDESTSALDSETEVKVQEALKDVMKNRTTIVIAHRLSTVYMADRIVVLEEGKIVEAGTHLELLRKGGVYDRLWRLQSGGYLPE